MLRIILLLTLLVFTPTHAPANERLSVVELFTSQGCSSCPPADAFLGKLAKRPDVLALAYHVDYWDYIGWEDVHAKAAFSDRQRDYAKKFNLRYVYTPQMIVNGTYQSSGNKQHAVIGSIKNDLSSSKGLEVSHNGTVLNITGSDHNDTISIYHVRYLKEVTTEVRRGENRGKTLTDYHIVTSLKKLGNWQGGSQSLPLGAVNKEENEDQAIFLQRQSDMKILTAIKL
ncbi:conserved hypothetical protein [Candidatus Terasakiella magnetica]|uniref:Secreted protein n=1 Tax=Candidatus Terasakiella magnetica TaxID=1867952 RepID=A0A1C3RIJ9_9PROT|nr:DUF1223 domain-containing protein [Candidatus Terasakiella magnetica]SCA57092.1 conserved hypothetical protein [Candidatus Terasakiella magnetica]